MSLSKKHREEHTHAHTHTPTHEKRNTRETHIVKLITFPSQDWGRLKLTKPREERERKVFIAFKDLAADFIILKTFHILDSLSYCFFSFNHVELVPKKGTRETLGKKSELGTEKALRRTNSCYCSLHEVGLQIKCVIIAE